MGADTMSEYRVRLKEFLDSLQCDDARKEIEAMIDIHGVEATVMW